MTTEMPAFGVTLLEINGVLLVLCILAAIWRVWYDGRKRSRLWSHGICPKCIQPWMPLGDKKYGCKYCYKQIDIGDNPSEGTFEPPVVVLEEKKPEPKPEPVIDPTLFMIGTMFDTISRRCFPVDTWFNVRSQAVLDRDKEELKKWPHYSNHYFDPKKQPEIYIPKEVLAKAIEGKKYLRSQSLSSFVRDYKAWLDTGNYNARGKREAPETTFDEWNRGHTDFVVANLRIKDGWLWADLLFAKKLPFAFPQLTTGDINNYNGTSQVTVDLFPAAVGKSKVVHTITVEFGQPAQSTEGRVVEEMELFGLVGMASGGWSEPHPLDYFWCEKGKQYDYYGRMV